MAEDRRTEANRSETTLAVPHRIASHRIADAVSLRGLLVLVRSMYTGEHPVGTLFIRRQIAYLLYLR